MKYLCPRDFRRGEMERKIEEWETMIDTNIKGVLHAVAAVLPIMREQRKGLIMNVISTAAYRVMEHSAIYSATKAAVRAFSEGLRKEETNHGIRRRPRKNCNDRMCCGHPDRYSFSVYFSQMCLATCTPLALACDREWVTPLQSPMTKRPLQLVSRFSSTSTCML